MADGNNPNVLKTTLAERLLWIISENKLKQKEFAKALGVSANYVYLLTSGRKTNISEPLAKLIEKTYGYSSKWVLSGETTNREAAKHELQACMLRKIRQMDSSDLKSVADFINTLDVDENSMES